MTTKHTPGPWTVQDMSKASHPRNKKWLGWWRIRTAEGDLLADCRAVGLRITDAEIVSNARLIAAAPELLDAATEALHALEQHQPAIHPAIRRHLEAAIAKAEGRE